MSDLVIQNDHEFPAINEFWQKVSDDLQQGFRIEGQHPNYRDVIRVWAKLAEELQFLLIATATQGLNVPVSSLEMHVYGQENKSWRVHMLQHPFPEPYWRHEWQALENMYPVGVPDFMEKKKLINSYLKAEVDAVSTMKTFKESLANLGEGRLSWVGRQGRSEME